MRVLLIRHNTILQLRSDPDADGVLRDSSVMRLPADQFHCNPDKSNMSPSMRKMLPPLSKL